MSRRHRVAFQATPVWHAGSVSREPVDLLRPGRAPPPRRPPGRHPGRRLLVLAVTVVLVWAAGSVLGADEDPDPPDPTPDRTSVPDPTGRAESTGRIFAQTRDVVAPPFRGTVNRYWASADDRSADRAHVVVLETARGGALLVADATRRATVHHPGAVTSPAGVAVRSLSGDGLRILEWDRPGWGLSLTTQGLGLDDGLRMVDAVAVPGEPAAGSRKSPVIDVEVLVTVGLRVADERSHPASKVGGPLLGQAGLDAVEAYVYRPDVGQPVSFLLTGALDPSLRASDLEAALGAGVVVDPSWRDDGLVVALDLATDAPVGFRLTGERRIVYDHPSGVTFWLASDEMSLSDLVAAGGSVDFDLVALRMTRT